VAGQGLRRMDAVEERLSLALDLAVFVFRPARQSNRDLDDPLRSIGHCDKISGIEQRPALIELEAVAQVVDVAAAANHDAEDAARDRDILDRVVCDRILLPDPIERDAGRIRLGGGDLLIAR
jgi:hypothetical protein